MGEMLRPVHNIPQKMRISDSHLFFLNFFFFLNNRQQTHLFHFFFFVYTEKTISYNYNNSVLLSELIEILLIWISRKQNNNSY